MATESESPCFIIYVSNLPFTMPEDEVLQFLGLNPSQINQSIMCKNKRGQPSGDCFVSLNDEKAAENALARSGTRTSGENSRRITVSKSSPEEMDDPDSSIRNKDKWDGIMKLRGFPGKATVQHVKDFLEGINYNENSIVMPRNHQDMSIGEAFVQFNSYGDAEIALARNREILKTLQPERYIETLKSTNLELRRCIVATIKQNANNSGMGNMGGSSMMGGMNPMMMQQMQQMMMNMGNMGNMNPMMMQQMQQMMMMQQMQQNQGMMGGGMNNSTGFGGMNNSNENSSGFGTFGGTFGQKQNNDNSGFGNFGQNNGSGDNNGISNSGFGGPPASFGGLGQSAGGPMKTNKFGSNGFEPYPKQTQNGNEAKQEDNQTHQSDQNQITGQNENDLSETKPGPAINDDKPKFKIPPGAPSKHLVICGNIPNGLTNSDILGTFCRIFVAFLCSPFKWPFIVPFCGKIHLK